MKRYRLLKYTLISLILLASWSCGLTGSDTENLSLPSELDGVDDISLPDYPLISSIAAEPRVVSPGDQVALTGANGLSGLVTFTTPSGNQLTVDLLEGSGLFTLPQDALAGFYTGTLETETGALAISSFRASGEPGVWLRASQRYVSASEMTVLSIDVSRLPEETVAAVYVQSEPGGPFNTFVPDEAGRLAPGIPVPLDDLVGRALLLEAGLRGAIQVRVEPSGSDLATGIIFSDTPATADAEFPSFDGWISNTLQISACNEPGTITGEMAGGGFVNAVWADGTLRSNAVYTADGAFALEAGPGMVLVQRFHVDAEPLMEPVNQLVAVGCGESIHLAQAGIAKVAAVSSLRYWTAPRSNSGQSPGEFLTSRLAAQSGGGEPCRTGIIVPNVRDADGLNRLQSALASVALKIALNEAASQAMVHSLSDAQALLEAIAEAQSTSADEEDWDSMMEAVQSMAASDFVISLTAARIGQRYGVNTAALPTLPEDAQVRASGQGDPGALFDPTFSVYAELAEKFGQAAICGSAEPEREQIDMDEELTIRYRVTDLSGEGAVGASVRISPPECGRLDPDTGSVEGEQFETRFTFHTDEYCAEELEFEAEWSGPQGMVKTRPEESIVHISPELPELTLYAGAAPGIGNTAALATAITLYEDYDVKDQPAVISPFTQDLQCGFLEGGLELTNQYFFARSESVGKRAESLVQFFTSADEVGTSEDVPVNRILLNMQLDTWAIEIEDENVIRGAWASGANHSDPNLTRSPGTLLVFDVKNPGNLPTTPIVNWQLRGSIDDASGYSVLVFYKVIECGDDPAIDSLFSFVADGGILLESDSEIPGPPTGVVTLPEFKGDRQQIIMWVTSLLTTASIRDDDAGANIGGRARLHFQLSVNLAQEIR
jgi:hypothetical protein